MLITGRTGSAKFIDGIAIPNNREYIIFVDHKAAYNDEDRFYMPASNDLRIVMHKAAKMRDNDDKVYCVVIFEKVHSGKECLFSALMQYMGNGWIERDGTQFYDLRDIAGELHIEP